MPNWTEQQLHVVGSKTEIDRFLRVGYTPRRRGAGDAVLQFDALCPTPAPDAAGAQMDSGVALTHWRTTNQACFDLITPWDYPAWFYELLATKWPTLSFCCVVSGEMGDFGGLLMGLDGQFVNHVEDFVGDYNRRAHRRAANASMKRWMAFLTRDRDWRIVPDRVWEKVPCAPTPTSTATSGSTSAAARRWPTSVAGTAARTPNDASTAPGGGLADVSRSPGRHVISRLGAAKVRI